jgi:hypothetical protein
MKNRFQNLPFKRKPAALQPGDPRDGAAATGGRRRTDAGARLGGRLYSCVEFS